MKKADGLTASKRTPEEIEALLAKDFGDKLQPVDTVRLAKQKYQQRERRKLASALAKRSGQENDDSQAPEAD